jgi:hypothetical protein
VLFVVTTGAVFALSRRVLLRHCANHSIALQFLGSFDDNAFSQHRASNKHRPAINRLSQEGGIRRSAYCRSDIKECISIRCGNSIMEKSANLKHFLRMHGGEHQLHRCWKC